MVVVTVAVAVEVLLLKMSEGSIKLRRVWHENSQGSWRDCYHHEAGAVTCTRGNVRNFARATASHSSGAVVGIASWVVVSEREGAFAHG